MANNPYVNKVEYGGNVLIDLTEDNITPERILAGYKAHDGSGASIVGTIPNKFSGDLTVEGATVTVPVGYFPSTATATIASGSATTPATPITVTPSLSVNASGVVTATVSGVTESITPTVVAGYVTTGTAGNVTVSGSGTLALTTKAAATYNTSTSDQTIAAGQYLTGAQTIKAVKITDGASSTTINASNVRDGVTIKVGDANKDDRIIAVTGTFSSASTITGTGISAAGASQILSGYAAFIDGAQVNGSVSAKAAATYYVSASDQTIAGGQYLSGTQTIKAVKITDGTGSTTINASNVRYGTTIKVGDANDDDRIIAVSGTFSAANTVSSEQTAAAAGQILSGYSAFVDGAEVKGNIPIRTDSGVIVTNDTVHVNPGYYSTDVEKSVRSGSATTPATTITANPTITVGSDGTITATTSGSKSITPTVSAGWVSAGTAGTVTVAGTKTATINHNFVGSDAIEATILGSLSIDPDTGVASVTFLPNDPNGDVQYLNSRIAFDQSAITPGWFNGDTYTDQWIDGQFNSAESEIHLTAESSQLPVQAAATITPTESAQTAVAKGKWTTGAVTVAAIPSNYVGSGITRRSSSDLTASGATVTAPAGYYSSAATYTIASGSARTPATTVTANPTFSFNASTGKLTATASATKSVTPTVVAGYVSSGTAGTITVSGSNTYTLTASTLTEGVTTVSGSTATRGTLGIGQGWEVGQTYAAATFANVATSGTTYVDISSTTAAPVLVSGSYLFINKGYVDNLKISLARLVPDGASADLASNKILQGYSAYDRDGALIAGSIPSKTAQTYTPTTTNQTIAAGQYLSGIQTIAGDANLIAANIKEGVQLFGITGTHIGGQISYTETDNEAGGKTVTIIFTGDNYAPADAEGDLGGENP